MQFLAFIILAQGIKIEEKIFQVVKTWPEPKLVKDI